MLCYYPAVYIQSYTIVLSPNLVCSYISPHNIIIFERKNKVTLVVSYQEHFVFVIYYHSTLLGILTKTEDRSD